jgi:hypothetical protein
MEAAKKTYPHLKPCFIEPMVDLYLTKPAVFKEIIKNDMKRDAKAKKTPIEPKQSLFESAVRIGRAENEEKSTGVVVEEDAEAREDLA